MELLQMSGRDNRKRISTRNILCYTRSLWSSQNIILWSTCKDQMSKWSMPNYKLSKNCSCVRYVLNSLARDYYKLQNFQHTKLQRNWGNRGYGNRGKVLHNQRKIWVLLQRLSGTNPANVRGVRPKFLPLGKFFVYMGLCFNIIQFFIDKKK